MLFALFLPVVAFVFAVFVCVSEYLSCFENNQFTTIGLPALTAPGAGFTRGPGKVLAMAHRIGR